ncbi:integral peroxisomal membrane peroxin-domain-containing protein [Cubamyces menziesii]|nr:integral peroxisomal membrane peroxin-domain-containing protein [Cubamyces menziesii]
MSKPSDDVVHASPLVEFLNALPSPLTTILVGLAPSIARARYLTQLLFWKAPWEDCCLVLALWWTVCLIPEFGLRYILPPAGFLLIIALRSRPPQQNIQLATEETIQRAIADLTTIHALLPTLPSFASAAAVPPLLVLARVFAVLYIPYLLVTYLIRLRILLAIIGTILFTWRARWAAVIRRGLWRSAHLRWATYRAWSVLSGQPLPPIVLSPQSQSDASLATLTSNAASSDTSPPPSPGASIRFLFTIYENQRWWMGLDWTAALLPGERPSWCSASQQPAAPPSAFTLPAPTTVYTLAPDGKRRLKRTARWKWEEPEWRVVVRREGAGTSRVERPLPSAKEESVAAAGASRILKKMRQPSVDSAASSSERKSLDGHRDKDGDKGFFSEDGILADGSGAGRADEDGEDTEPFTDPDGWVYADNKWEGGSSKGGMGKYTRYRRWTRVAVLTETVELVGPGELGIQRDEPLPISTSSVPQQAESPAPSTAGDAKSSTSTAGKPQVDPSTAKDTTTSSNPTAQNGHAPANGDPSLRSKGTGSGTTAAAGLIVQPAEDEGSRLRQRLKAAVKGATGHS